jgi:hypothetical protein
MVDEKENELSAIVQQSNNLVDYHWPPYANIAANIRKQTALNLRVCLQAKLENASVLRLREELEMNRSGSTKRAASFLTALD